MAWKTRKQGLESLARILRREALVQATPDLHPDALATSLLRVKEAKARRAVLRQRERAATAAQREPDIPDTFL